VIGPSFEDWSRMSLCPDHRHQANDVATRSLITYPQFSLLDRVAQPVTYSRRWQCAQPQPEKQMGGEPYHYLVEYDSDTQTALDHLRQDVFASGRYRGAHRRPRSPDDALERSGESGTASILDIRRVGSRPDYGVAAPFSRDELIRYTGTERPTAEQLETSDAMWEALQRGMARYTTIYEEGRPSKIFFVGYSFD